MVFGSRAFSTDRLGAICLISLAFFVLFIFLPPVYVLTYAFKTSFRLDSAGEAALVNTFVIGLVVTFFDLLFGLPVAWVLARRKKMPMRRLIDTLIDMPLVVPTSVLGLSVFYFWGGGIGALLGISGGLVSKGPILIALLHIVFTFPYVVRSIEASIAQLNKSHEQAATMLGASQLTVFRTISLPLFKSGVISGAILAFTRSLSETGATMMVAGVYATAPTMVVTYKKALDIPSAAAVSIVLISCAVLLLIVAKMFSGGFKVPILHVWPAKERMLSTRFVGKRDAIIAIAVITAILLPTFYIVISGLDTLALHTLIALAQDWPLIDSILISFGVGLAVTVINLLLAIPLAMLIARNIFRVGGIVDTMSDIILLVPTSALGLSLSLFWKNFSLGDLPILVLAHLSFTFPLMLKPISGAIGGVDQHMEDAARTLGARHFKVFQTITYPLIRPAIIAGIIMTFMRSLSETGATMSVSEKIKTVPVLLVDLFTKGKVDDKTILACILLFILSFVFIFCLKMMDSRKDAKDRGQGTQ
jgi:thiamine transport system permease protein